MSRVNLTTMTVQELVQRFTDIGLAQDEALLDDDLGRFNLLFKQMRAVVEELKARPNDQRQALIVLYDHPNLQVRLKAAIATLAVGPAPARAVLQAIRESKIQPQALDAGMSIINLDRGIFKPK